MWEKEIDIHQVREIRARTTVFLGVGAIAKIDDICADLKARVLKRPQHHLGVHLIFGTAERYHTDFCHAYSSNSSNSAAYCFNTLLTAPNEKPLRISAA